MRKVKAERRPFSAREVVGDPVWNSFRRLEFSIVTRANKAWIPELIAAADPEITVTYIAFFHYHDP